MPAPLGIALILLIIAFVCEYLSAVGVEALSRSALDFTIAAFVCVLYGLFTI